MPVENIIDENNAYKNKTLHNKKLYREAVLTKIQLTTSKAITPQFNNQSRFYFNKRQICQA